MKKLKRTEECTTLKRKIFNLFMVLLVVNQIVLSGLLYQRTKDIDSLEIVLDDQNLLIDIKSNTIDYLIESLEKVNAINEQLDESIKVLKNDNLHLSREYEMILDEYEELKKRKELYDKYSYALVYDGKRTDLRYSQVETLETLSEKAGINTHLPLAIGCVESKFDSDLRSTISTATGSWQFLKETGKFTYETLMENEPGSYNHDMMATDNDISLQMVVAYLSYLKERRGTGYEIIKGYSGSPEPSWYIERMNRHLSEVGLSFNDIIE